MRVDQKLGLMNKLIETHKDDIPTLQSKVRDQGWDCVFVGTSGTDLDPVFSSPCETDGGEAVEAFNKSFRVVMNDPSRIWSSFIHGCNQDWRE